MSSTDNQKMDVDKMLEHVGDIGKYQIILMLLFCLINILSGFHYFGQTFISITPQHQCRNLNSALITNVSECYQIISSNNNNTKKIKCTNGWLYNNSYGYISIVEELDWICENDWKPAIGQSVFFIGSVIGTLILGVLADRIGRLHVLVISFIFAFAGNIATIFSYNVTIFAISRFIAGCATDSNFVMMYIIVMEYIRPNMRTFGLNLCIGIFYCLSCVSVPWIAVGLGNWKLFLLIISLPDLIVFGFYFIVPESTQWLISKGRIDQAISGFHRIAKINKRVINQKHLDDLKEYCNEHISNNSSVKYENLIGLLKTPKLRKKTLILTFKSMVMTLCYDAMSRNINGMGYSPFIIFSTTSLTIFPACLIILAIQDRIGRKLLASGSFLLSGIFIICLGILQALSFTTSNPSLLIGIAIIARLAVNIAYNSGHQYAVELIPTVVRGQGVGAIHVAGYAASVFSPQILYLSTIWKPLPEFILGSLLISGAIACLYLPETLNRTLPVTLQDGEEFEEDENLLKIICCRCCCRAPTESMITLTTHQYNKYT